MEFSLLFSIIECITYNMDPTFDWWKNPTVAIHQLGLCFGAKKYLLFEFSVSKMNRGVISTFCSTKKTILFLEQKKYWCRSGRAWKIGRNWPRTEKISWISKRTLNSENSFNNIIMLMRMNTVTITWYCLYRHGKINSSFYCRGCKTWLCV